VGESRGRFVVEEDPERLLATQEQIMADRKADREHIDVNLKNLKEDIKSNKAEMRTTICAIRSELEGPSIIKSKASCRMSTFRRELTETIKNADGITDSRTVPRHTSTDLLQLRTSRGCFPPSTN
jgi:hypothetical protein